MAYDEKTFKLTRIFNAEFVDDLNDQLDDLAGDIEAVEQNLTDEVDRLEEAIDVVDAKTIDKWVFDGTSLSATATPTGTKYFATISFATKEAFETFFGKTMKQIADFMENGGEVHINNMLITIDGSAYRFNAHFYFEIGLDWTEQVQKNLGATHDDDCAIYIESGRTIITLIHLQEVPKTEIKFYFDIIKPNFTEA